MFGWFRSKKKKEQEPKEIVSNLKEKYKKKDYPATPRRASDDYDYMARKSWHTESYPTRREENSLLDPVVPTVLLAAMLSENNQASASTPEDSAVAECFEDRNSPVSVCEDRNSVSSYDQSPSYDSSPSYSDSGSSYSDSGGSYNSGD